MGRGWQDRRGDKLKTLVPAGPPGASPPPSPPSTSEDHALAPEVEPLPKSVLIDKTEAVRAGTGFKFDAENSRFPILGKLMPLGALSRAPCY